MSTKLQRMFRGQSSSSGGAEGRWIHMGINPLVLLSHIPPPSSPLPPPLSVLTACKECYKLYC